MLNVEPTPRLTVAEGLVRPRTQDEHHPRPVEPLRIPERPFPPHRLASLGHEDEVGVGPRGLPVVLAGLVSLLGLFLLLFLGDCSSGLGGGLGVGFVGRMRERGGLPLQLA